MTDNPSDLDKLIVEQLHDPEFAAAWTQPDQLALNAHNDDPTLLDDPTDRTSDYGRGFRAGVIEGLRLAASREGRLQGGQPDPLRNDYDPEEPTDG